MLQVPGRDLAFIEAINKNMSVPERLRVSLRQQWREEEEGKEATRMPEEPPQAYTMMVPDRLTYTEAPDMSPRPLFTPSKPTVRGPLEPCWESPSGEVCYREALQSPLRRSYSDQSFGRTTPGARTQLRPEVALPRNQSSLAKESWSPEEEEGGGGGGGAAVEFIVLRRQVLKMSRRLAALERHSVERRKTEVVLFTLLFSACLLNSWLWIRR